MMNHIKCICSILGVIDPTSPQSTIQRIVEHANRTTSEEYEWLNNTGSKNNIKF